MTIDTSLLPLGIASFSEIRNNRLVYVDKTRMIHELASSRAPVFLSRPRRFGKSLLVSTFESLFSKGLEEFKGLKIENLWKDKTYRVIRLDCSGLGVNDFDQFVFKFEEKLLVAMISSGFSLDGFPKNLSPLSQFNLWLRGHISTGTQLVLLIDEYDAPLTAQLNNPDLFEKIRTYLSSFYSTIKENKAAFRFVFITGIARFQKSSIFSTMNNLDDITLNVDYGTIAGYTQEELEEYFSPYLEYAAQMLDMTIDELLAGMETQYDGFCFDDEGKYRLYNPWSILKFLKYSKHGFKNYWFDSAGQASLVMGYFKGHALPDITGFDKSLSVGISDLTDTSDLATINPVVLLTQAGYYTIDKINSDRVYLRYPNKEVTDAMAKLYRSQAFRNDATYLSESANIRKNLFHLSAKELVEKFNHLFIGLSYGTEERIKNESDLQSVLYAFLCDRNYLRIQMEKANVYGRSDLALSDPNGKVACVMELKYCRDKDLTEKEAKKKANKLLREAVAQIKERHYGEEIGAEKLMQVALVFSERERKFVLFATV